MNQNRVINEPIAITDLLPKDYTGEQEMYELHKDILVQLHQTYARKNHDYGNSFHKVREEFPNAVLIRLMDKLERLKTIYNSTSLVLDESIEDTLLALANYAIMEVVERQMAKL